MAAKPSSKFVRVLRWLLFGASVAHLAAVIAVLYALEHCTEEEWYLSPLLYLPPQGWLLPLAVLGLMAVFLRPLFLVLHVASVVTVFLWFMHFHGPEENADLKEYQPEQVLTVVTANIGQRNVKKLQPFLDSVDADVIAFQENVYREQAFDQGNNGYAVRIEGEFTLASKLPIRESAIVPDLTFDGRPVAARFELEYKNRRIAVYNVHMPTPRSYLYELRGRGFLVESVMGGGLFDPEKQHDYQYYWTNRFALARSLLVVLANEKLPVIICGDFNTPDHGGVYQLFAREYRDTFAAAGRGYGFTFPGDTHMPVAGYGPWLRLDYQFADEHWQAIECLVEPPVRAQHLALEASYLFKE